MCDEQEFYFRKLELCFVLTRFWKLVAACTKIVVMINFPMRNVSFLGFMLTIVSALVGAVIPPIQHNPDFLQPNGTLDVTADGGFNTATCNPAISGATCFNSATGGLYSDTTGFDESTGLGGANTEEGSTGDFQ